MPEQPLPVKPSKPSKAVAGAAVSVTRAPNGNCGAHSAGLLSLSTQVALEPMGAGENVTVPLPGAGPWLALHMGFMVILSVASCVRGVDAVEQAPTRRHSTLTRD